MKLLAFTDLHAMGRNPRARLDNYPETMARKLLEVFDIARQHKCRAILFGGDLTDVPDVASSVVRDLIHLLRQAPCPIYGVSGNSHDVWGNNPETIRRTALGIIEAAGLISLIRPGKPEFLDNGVFYIQITGQPYHPEIDRRERVLDYCVLDPEEAPEGHQHIRDPVARYCIHIVHGMLRLQPFPADVPVTLVENILPRTRADITLSGHDHIGFGVVEQGPKIACNPGALMRLSAAKEEIERPVQVALLNLTEHGCSVQLIPLKCAAPGAEVLDRSHIEEAHARREALDESLEGVRSGGEMEALDVASIVESIAKHKDVPDPVRIEALERVAEAQEALKEGAVEEVVA